MKRVKYSWLTTCGAISSTKRLVCVLKKAHDGPHHSMIMQYKEHRGRFEWSGADSAVQEKWVSVEEGG